MTEIRKVVVNGQEYEVHLEQDGEMWKATVQGCLLYTSDADDDLVGVVGGGGRSSK